MTDKEFNEASALKEAQFMKPASVRVQFMDGVRAVINLRTLGIRRIVYKSIRAQHSSLEFENRNGAHVSYCGTIVRSKCDRAFAAELKKRTEAMSLR